MWSRPCWREHNCDSLNGREIAIVIAELAGNPFYRMPGKAFHREVSHQRHSRQNCLMRVLAVGAGFWVTIGTVNWRSQALGKPCVLQELDAWEAASRCCMMLPREHTQTRKQNCFLLQCLSVTIDWQNLTLWQLAKKKIYLKGQDSFLQSRQKGWIWCWKAIN